MQGPHQVAQKSTTTTLPFRSARLWAPSVSLKEGLGYTHAWIKEQIAAYGADPSALTSSTVVSQAMTDKCDMGNKGEGK